LRKHAREARRALKRFRRDVQKVPQAGAQTGEKAPAHPAEKMEGQFSTEGRGAPEKINRGVRQLD